MNKVRQGDLWETWLYGKRFVLMPFERTVRNVAGSVNGVTYEIWLCLEVSDTGDTPSISEWGLPTPGDELICRA